MTTSPEIADRLRALQLEDGRLLPEVVVEDFKDPASPYHALFLWNDDTEAARQHRLMVARRMIGGIRLEVVVNKIPLRAPVYIREPGAPAYRATLVMRTDEQQAAEAVKDAMDRAQRAIKRAKTVAAILDMEADIVGLEELVADIVGRANTFDQPEGNA